MPNTVNVPDVGMQWTGFTLGYDISFNSISG